MTELDKGTILQWRRFIGSEAGQAGLRFLEERTPSIAKGEPHHVQFDAGYNQGYVKCLERILSDLITPRDKEESIDNP